MAFLSESSNQGPGRNLCAEVNLVPFIDLLSMSICFLLMTAVWIQTSAVTIRQTHGVDAPATRESVTLKLSFAGRGVVAIEIRQGRSRKSLRVAASTPEGMREQLGESLRKLFPDGKGPGTEATAVITADAGVPYGELVRVIDVLREHQFVNLGVTPKEAR